MKYTNINNTAELALKYQNILRQSIDPNIINKKEYPISEIIYYNDLNSVKQRISDWVAARLVARNSFVPDWTDLIRVYDYVIIDGHVFGIINGIKQKIKGKEFVLYSKNGEINTELTEELNKRWFSRYSDYFIEAFFYPFSLIELGDYDKGFNDIKMIKREYIVPQYKSVKMYLAGHAVPKYIQHNAQTGTMLRVTDPGSYALDYFEGEERINDYIFVECPLHDLGLLDMAAPHALGKMGSLAMYLDYLQKFVVPFRHGKTNINDNLRRNNMDAMMAAWGGSGYAVTDLEDEISILEQGGTAVAPFDTLFSYSNNEISKAFASAVGIFDEKSFVGSSEAGERMMDAIIQSYAKEFEFNVNDELLPRLAMRDRRFEGLSFEYVSKENIPYSQRVDAVVKLADLYKLDLEEVSQKTDFKIEEKEIPEPLQNALESPKEEKEEEKEKPILGEKKDLSGIAEKPSLTMAENAKRALKWVKLKKIQNINKEYLQIADKIIDNQILTFEDMLVIEGCPESEEPYSNSVDSVIFDLCGGKEGYNFAKNELNN